MKLSPCMDGSTGGGGANLQVWVANTDSEEEGVWRDRDTGKVNTWTLLSFMNGVRQPDFSDITRGILL